MTDNRLDDIVACMAIHDGDGSIQRIQTEHRLKLAEYWGITKGSRVLEIGCGQGDTTAVLAYLAGESGLVKGIDVASPDYGGPITLGQAADHLKKSKLGKQVQIHFEVDILSPEVDFADKEFDFIVLSHCSWYFKSAQQFAETLKKCRKWGKQLAFAEWDARITRMEQYPHLLAILLQAQYECFKENSLSNVRTLFTADDVRQLAEAAGWRVTRENSLASEKLQDGGWEVAGFLHGYYEELDSSVMPDKLKSLIASEAYLLKEALKHTPHVKSMSTFALVAKNE
ncbi:class I SAM-dependent methyltransferase [Paenibacillus paridis]|uniref:class I SAM-dependent methyltransferase n=1 Tax=Paenibacillus paridis TaxID=2583376 RepID=UPI001EE40FE6|nr:class I SAM-dependent methyltransferase [Paenibacillus paridis]